MPEKITDRRVRKTKQQFRQGLTDLMKMKSIKDITVKELTEYVDMNRGTFYLHYRDVFDLLEQMEQELLDKMVALFEKYDPRQLAKSPRLIYADLFSVIKENSDLCQVLLSTNGDIAFLNQLKTAIYEKCLSHWSQLSTKKSNPKQEYFAAFILAGYIGLLQFWVDKDMPVSTDELANMGEEFILEGIKSVL